MALEPYPEALLERLFERTPEPLARHDPREAIRLAFVAALQRLPPRERAVLALCDVAGFEPDEAAAMLGLDPAARRPGPGRRPAPYPRPTRPRAPAPAVPGLAARARAARPLRRRVPARRRRRPARP